MSATAIEDLAAALLEKQFPAVTISTRLEGRPRTRDFSRSLQAEVRDALWMLTRQWQTGEFEGDDAGSPTFTRLHIETATLDKYQAGEGNPQPFPTSAPLEAVVERMPIEWQQGGQAMCLDLRLMMGRYWMKLLQALPAYRPAFLEAYPISEVDSGGAHIAPHPDVVQIMAALAGRCMDGGRLFLHLKSDARHRPYDGLAVSELDKPALDAMGGKFLKWVERLVFQPETEANYAWDSARLEYRFRCSHPVREGERVLSASEYSEGRLDWYSFNIDDRASPLNVEVESTLGSRTSTQIAGPARFAGMPKSRWWEFEDGQTNFGDISASTTDLAKLLFIEFGLLYANDWFVVPCTLPAGSFTKVRGLVVTNIFGERFWIEAAGRGPGEDWTRWSMFTLSHEPPRGDDNQARPAEVGLVLPPVLPQSLESPPVEEVLFFRDEVANMVWAVEKTVPLMDGVSKPGAEAAAEFKVWRERDRSPRTEPALPPDVQTRYRLMNSVPGNWIPFVPVHVDDPREVQLQRARVAGPDGLATPPRTSILRTGLDLNQKYLVHEEEVPRSGIRLTKTFQRARWTNGRVILWSSLRKQVGRGEGSSGLAFDQIEPS